MPSSTQQRPATAAEDMGLGPKKTALVLFTVVGCIAILFPKIFYPMIVGPPNMKDATRGPPSEFLMKIFENQFNYLTKSFRPSKARTTTTFA